MGAIAASFPVDFVAGTLADGRTSILGEGSLNFTDFSFAAMTGLWLQPAGYGGGKAEYVLVARDNLQ